MTAKMSSTKYSEADLHYDKINLATINAVRHDCVRFALDSKDLANSSRDKESFIEWAHKFYEKKELIYIINCSKHRSVAAA